MGKFLDKLFKNIILIFVLLSIFIGCGTSSNSTHNDQKSYYKPSIANTFQWQLQGNINTSYNADIYDIDLFDTNISTIEYLHNQNKKVICYFSAGSYENWREDKEKFPTNILGNNLDGWAGEKWLDISSNSLKSIMQDRLDLAKSKNCDGVEVDNIDGYTNNTGFSLNATDQLNYNKFLALEAHNRGLSIALKNDIAQLTKLEPYFDFAINEQCHQYNECQEYNIFLENDKPVFNIEYNSIYLDDDNMTKLCNSSNNNHLTTLIMPIDLDDSFRYDCKDFIYDKFKVGYGSSSSFKFYDNRYLDSTDLMFGDFSSIDNIVDFNQTAFSKLSTYLQKSRYIVYWVTQGWQTNWYDLNKTQEAIDKGKVPVFIYWWFGDKLMNGISNNDVTSYLQDVDKLQDFLTQLNGEHIIILEPEFNKQNILSDLNQQTLFISAISQAIDKLKQPQRKISLCMMDTGNRDLNDTSSSCGYCNCALGDKSEWDKVEPIYLSLIDKLDFISFQEMIGQFSRDDSDPGTWDNPNPKAYTNEELGIDYLSQRIDNFATYLKNKYNKNVFLPYITIATATWNDTNSDGNISSDEVNATGWDQKASAVYKDLNSTNLFGYATMELFDDPEHDKGGYQYFMDNEYHLGIISSDINNSQLTGNIHFKSDIIQQIFK